MCRRACEMFVPPLGLAGHSCWGLPCAALGKKTPLDFSNWHVQFLVVFSYLRGAWCIIHMIYFAGIKGDVFDSLPAHPGFHCAVGGTVQGAGGRVVCDRVVRPPWKMHCLYLLYRITP